MFFKIGVLKNFQIIHRKTPVLEYLFNKAAGLKSCNFIQKRFQHSCFPVNIAKFLRTAFFIEHLRWLLLSLINTKRYRNDQRSGFVLLSLLLNLNIFYNFFNHSVVIVHFEHVHARCFQNMYVSSR